MVRLKDLTPPCPLRMRSRISIPYGSIKSFLGISPQTLSSISIPYGSIKRRCPPSASTTCACISIPYGSIKRLTVIPDFHAVLSFQFLMVRLKDANEATFKSFYNNISIPYGSIKSKMWHKLFLISNTFQFLMVRLKVYCHYNLLLLIAISIPYGSIKSF